MFSLIQLIFNLKNNSYGFAIMSQTNSCLFWLMTMLNVQDWVFLSDTRLWHGFCTQLQWERFPWASNEPSSVWGNYINLFIYYISSIHTENKKTKSYNNSLVWIKWPTQCRLSSSLLSALMSCINTYAVCYAQFLLFCCFMLLFILRVPRVQFHNK